MINVIVKNKRFFQSSSLAFVVFTLSACGGGGSSSAGDGSAGDGQGVTIPDTKAEVSAITEDNYIELAKMAMPQALQSSREPESVNETMSLSSQSMTPDATAVECDSGSGSSIDSFQKPIGLSNGDHYETTYDNCKNNTPGGGYILTDGKVKVDYEIFGDYLAGGIGTYGSDALYEKWIFESKLTSLPSSSLMFDGDMVNEGERTAVSNRWKQYFKNMLIETKDEGDATSVWSIFLTESTTEWVDNISEGTYTLKSEGSIAMGSGYWFFFDFELHSDLTGSLKTNGGRNTATGGVLTVLDNTSPAIVTITVNGSNALVEYDSDGDMIPELTQTISVEEFML